ncbi:type II secretion system F family protein [Corynebacterium sp. sy039]|uniref:type II secretion system F family protein n=1 Tax=Corynebacterium sp. sy039 TaxID=2599641 RepID=UPI0011B74C6E|nr:type II secretion system F family protein [Corynebacterium sp. sy039]QDZ43310.1 hypothetical protein FQV43_09235 [Corynebacterium sp. sy039]
MITFCCAIACSLLLWDSSRALRWHLLITHSINPRDGPNHDERKGSRTRGGRKRWVGMQKWCERWVALVSGHKNHTHPLDCAADVDLYASCISAGMSHSAAAAAVARKSHIVQWQAVAQLLALGMNGERAWQPLAQVDGLSELLSIARNSHRSGSAMHTGCTRLAQRLRTQAQTQSIARAQRAGVLIAIPLALCFLPAFFILGLVPLVVSLGIAQL